MLVLRRILCACYGFLSIVFVVIIPSHILALLHPSLTSFFPADTEWIVLAMASVSLLVFGMAWWTVQTRKTWARFWALSASAVLILTMGPMLFGWRLMPLSFSGIYIALLAVGVAGLIVFARRGKAADAATSNLKPPRIAGDGTSRLSETLALLIGIAGTLAGMSLWRRWASSQGLPPSFGLAFWIDMPIALLLIITIHESGHALVGLYLGMKLRLFRMGPFLWHLVHCKWEFQFLPKGLLCQGGAASLVPTDPRQPRDREILMIAAGPLANLLTGFIAIALGLLAKGSPHEQEWYFFALFSTMSVVLFASNLVPIRPQVAYSDGARIYQILRGGPLADLHRCFALASAILVTPLRPRDYDIDALQRASDAFTEGQQAMYLRLLAYNHFHDCGQIPEACNALDQAEGIYYQSASEIPAQWHTVFVFGNAFLKRDPVSARTWWDRLQEKDPTNPDEIYWLCNSALLWSENKPQQANEAWITGHSLAALRPPAGAYDFNRDCFSQLRAAIDASPAPASEAANPESSVVSAE
jgi:hypothetical protein